MIRKLVKHELLYGIKSKETLFVCLALTALFCLSIFFSYENTMGYISEYNSTINYYTENDLDIEEDINSEFTILDQFAEGSVKSETVENPLAYAKYNVEQNMLNSSTGNSLSLFLGTIVVYFPIIFVLLGLLCVYNDIKNKTLKTKVAVSGKAMYIAGKIIVVIIESAVILTAALIIATIINHFVYLKLVSLVDNNRIELMTEDFNAFRILKQLSFAFFAAVFFSVIGIFLGVILRNIYVGIIAVTVPIFIVSTPLKYSPLNIINYFSQKLYNYYGYTQVSVVGNLSNSSIILLIAMLAAVITASVFIVKKRNAYI